MKQEQRRARVSFSRTLEVQECLHIRNYTEEERTGCWYSEQELSTIEAERLQSVELFNGGYVTDEQDLENHCRLGLGRQLKSLERGRSGAGRFMMVRKQQSDSFNRKSGLIAVLEEQMNQRRRGIVDEEAIAAAYRGDTKQSSSLKDLLDCSLGRSSASLKDLLLDGPIGKLSSSSSEKKKVRVPISHFFKKKTTKRKEAQLTGR